MMNMYTSEIPKPLLITGNLLENWKTFKIDFFNFLNATTNHDECSETKVAILLNVIGENGLKIFNSLILSESEVANINRVLLALEIKCSKISAQRLDFHIRVQKDNESFDEFVDVLKVIGRQCMFGDKEEYEIKHRISLGLTDADIKKLDNINEMPLEDVILLCKNSELYKNQQKLYAVNDQEISQQNHQGPRTKSTECVLQSTTSIIENVSTMKTDNLCGIVGYHPAWMQKYATSKTFIIIYGLLGTIQSMAFMYFVVSLTTLEKRFKIPSHTTGIILSGNEISQILLSLILSYAGGKRNRPRWIAWGVVFCSISCFVLILPHILYGAGEDILQLTKEYIYEHEDPTISQSTSTKMKDANKLCSAGSDIEECDELFSVVPLVLIFLSQFVLGIGNTLYFALGQSYLDDNTKKTNTPIMLAYAMTLRLLGPILGFVVAYFSLNIFIDPSKTPLINKNDPRWLGAWWLGWIIIGFSVLIFAFLIGLFPKEMPRKKSEIDLSEVPKILLADNNAEQTTGTMNNSETVVSPASTDIKDFGAALMRLLKNKLLMFNILAGIFYVLGASPYITFISKYMEVLYNRNASEATVVVGPISILGLVIGFLSSGHYISKYKPTMRKLFLWNSFVGFCCVLGQISYIYLPCDNGSMYTAQGIMNLTNSCNSRCSCDHVPYSPVCNQNSQTTYFSPCHAGCNNFDDKEKKYTNCDCIDKTTTEWSQMSTSMITNTTLSLITDPPTTAPASTLANEIFAQNVASEDFLVPGVCLAGCDKSFYIMNVISVIVNTLGGSARIGNVLLNFRVVSEKDKSFAQGLTLMLISLFALIPGPIIFGYIIDSACLIWNYKCEKRGNCQLYDQTKFRYSMNLGAVSLTFIAVLFDLLIWYYGKGVDLYGEKELKRKQEIERKNQYISPLLSKQSS